MKARLAQGLEHRTRADVCLGTDWFAAAQRKPHPAWQSLVGFGAHLMAGVKRFRPVQPRQRVPGLWAMRRHRPDIKP